MMYPLDKTQRWLSDEENAGSPYPMGAVLATVSPEGLPRSRVIQMRIIDENGALFFTQKKSRKVEDLTQHSYASLTLWLPLTKRQINLEGPVKDVSQHECEECWNVNPRIQQLKFSAYAPLTGEKISSPEELNERYHELERHYQGVPIPMSSEYVGFRLVPSVFYFYEFFVESFSKREKYALKHSAWHCEEISP